ncbi:MAG: GTP cyclohydrolase MptA [Synergistaceae bacterium]|jgi:GTP cyclohydrolase-4|nr:GTP cyclohydrolase MptA [Synergistaceae bacterium]
MREGGGIMESFSDDVQENPPSTRIYLSRVGVTGLRRVLRLKPQAHAVTRPHALFFAEMNLFAHLDAARSGVHMSRFAENIESIASEMASEASPNIETLAERMALAIARTQGTSRSEVRIRAQFPMTKRAPVSGGEVEDLFTFIGIAISDGRRTRRATGVEVDGLTVCPCARFMVAQQSRERLIASGYSARQADEIIALLPLASHNQRGRGTLIIGAEAEISAECLVELVESSMSSEIYALLKRPDELHVVTKAHANPRFVEDVVREMIKGIAQNLVSLPDDAFILARQENFESIHAHNAYAERCGLLGDVRAELASDVCRCGARVTGAHSLESWLDGLL